MLRPVCRLFGHWFRWIRDKKDPLYFHNDGCRICGTMNLRDGETYNHPRP